MPVVKLKDWKLARTFSADSIVILHILDLASRGLSPFKHYKPVASLIQEIKNTEVILLAHKNTADKILAAGKEDEREQ